MTAEARAGLTRRLAAWVGGLMPDDLGGLVQQRVQESLVDFLGLAAGGAAADSSRAVRALVLRLGGEAPTGAGAPVIGTGLRARPDHAALANGAAAHALELDDTHLPSSTHPGAAVLPAALAAASLARTGGPPVSGGVLAAAVVAGYEVTARVGMALRPEEHYGRGFHPTATCGAFGAAAAAARCLGLDAAATLAALGIAGSQAAGSHEYHAGDAWTKRLHPGLAARAGLVSALLAQEGFVAPRTILEGRDGFLRAGSGRPDPEALVRGLGQDPAILATSLKPHACCRHMHGPIDALLALRRAHGLTPEQVEQVTVELTGVAMAAIAEPAAVKSRPRTVQEAQFSMAFGAAVALVHGRASPAEFTPARLADPAVLALLPRVRCVHRPELDPLYPRLWPAVVRVETRGGQVVEQRVETAMGDPSHPLTRTEVEAKFRGAAARAWGPGQQDQVLKAVAGLDGAGDVSVLLDPLLPGAIG